MPDCREDGRGALTEMFLGHCPYERGSNSGHLCGVSKGRRGKSSEIKRRGARLLPGTVFFVVRKK